jgi:hypothetical protein
MDFGPSRALGAGDRLNPAVGTACPAEQLGACHAKQSQFGLPSSGGHSQAYMLGSARKTKPISM